MHPAFGSDQWLQTVLPTLTDEEAYYAVERMVDGGMEEEDIRLLVLPFLPRLGNALRKASAASRSGFPEPPDLWDRLLGHGWSSLLAAVAGCSFACGAASLGEPVGFKHALITAGLEGVGITLGLSGADTLDADEVAANLAARRGDQFAIVTSQFSNPGSGQVHVLLGCPTGRRDALTTVVSKRHGLLHAAPWAEVMPGAASVFIDRVMSLRSG